MRPTKLEFLDREIASQEKWIEQCGGDVAGYVTKYHYKHGRTLANALAIYKADVEALNQLRASRARVGARRRLP